MSGLICLGITHCNQLRSWLGAQNATIKLYLEWITGPIAGLDETLHINICWFLVGLFCSK